MKAIWVQKKLCDVSTLINGRAYSKPELLAEGKYLVLRVGNFFTNDHWYYSDLELDPDKYCQSGDLLYAWSASFGPRIWTGEKVIFHYHIWKVLPDHNLVDRNFLYFWFLWDVERIKADQGTGTTMTHVSKGSMEDRNILLPPLPEQRRIVGILDEALGGIATAEANAGKNLKNARALFQSHLHATFTQRDKEWGQKIEGHSSESVQASSDPRETILRAAADVGMAGMNSGSVTKTGGREATLRHIPGNLSLAVGMPSTVSRKGWRWTALADLARLESGHTPSRKHPEYWNGSIPWIGIQDARENHGQRITDTVQHTNALGIEKSSARVLPENTVCLSRTASVGYVVVMGRPMATSQDFVNWICSDRLRPEFLKYLLLAEKREGLLRYASGAVHQTIYFPEAKAFHICHPDVDEQLRIVRKCDVLHGKIQRLASIYQQKLTALDALKKSFLHQAFSGQL